jgi:hypothetical protein
MPLTATENTKSNLPPIEPGVYIATCYGLIDLGTHQNERFNKTARKVLIQWEIPDSRMDIERDGESLNLPRAISERYTLSLSEKANLRKALESWRGRRFTAEELKGFDLKNVLGKPCQIQVINESSKDGTRTYAKVGAIMALPKGTTAPALENPLMFFSFEDSDRPEIPETLPEWVRGLIQESEEWQNLTTKSTEEVDKELDEAFGPNPTGTNPDTENNEDDGPAPF